MSPESKRVYIPPGRDQEEIFKRLAEKHGWIYSEFVATPEEKQGALEAAWQEQSGNARTLVRQFAEKVGDPESHDATNQKVSQLILDAFINIPYINQPGTERAEHAHRELRSDIDWDGVTTTVLTIFEENLPEQTPEDIELLPSNADLQPFRKKDKGSRKKTSYLFPRDVALLIKRNGLHGEKPMTFKELQKEGDLVRKTASAAYGTATNAIKNNDVIRILVLKNPEKIEPMV